MTVQMSAWQVEKEELLRAFEDLKQNRLWRRIEEECALLEKRYQQLALANANDRACQRLIGRSEGVHELKGMPESLVETLCEYYDRCEEMETSERKREQDSVARTGEQGGFAGDTAARKVKRRHFFESLEPQAPES